MSSEISRRGFLGGLAALGLAACSGSSSESTATTRPAGPTSTSSTSIPVPDLPSDPFTLGVASGDPLPDRVVLWTRLAVDPTGEAAKPPVDVPVTWEIAADDGFTEIVGSGVARATPDVGHSVHVDPTGLESDTWYWYRFRVGDFESAVGRTRTAPARSFGTPRPRPNLGPTSSRARRGRSPTASRAPCPPDHRPSPKGQVSATHRSRGGTPAVTIPADSESMHKREGTYVERRIPGPLHSVIEDGPDFDWERDPNGPLGRDDLAPIRARTRIAGFEAEIELAPWSRSTTELGVRPLTRRPDRWSARRRRRWLQAAHDAADAFREQVIAS